MEQVLPLIYRGRAFLLAVFMFYSTSSFAQDLQTVSGTVTEADGKGIPGVTVMVKNTSIGTTTDLEGNYALNVPVDQQEAALIFSFVGYKTQEVPVANQSVINMTLVEDSKQLEEVVVVGYGTQRKQDITSAVSVIDMKNVGDVPASNVSRLLQGQAPGVQVKQTSGTPGEELKVNIRGISSLGAGSEPLYVVDGFAIGTSIGPYLTPDDIESISILKDAASTAIYGARGSNGVILITTKSAKAGKVGLSFAANYGVQNIPDSRRTVMMNGVEFAQFKKESFMDKIRYFEGREPAIEEVPLDYRYPEQTQYSTDWFDEITNQNAKFQDYNVTLTAGKGDIQSLVSVGYLNQEGAIIETGYKRFNARANVGGKINDFISMGWNIAGSHSIKNFENTNGRSAIIGKALWADPRFPVYNEDGSFNTYIGGAGGAFGAANPVQELVEMERNWNGTNLLSNGFLEFSFLKNFKFNTSVNVSLINSAQKEFRPSTLAGTGFNQPPPREAWLYQRSEELVNLSADQILTYAKVSGDHNFDAMVGFSAQEQTEKAISGSGNEFPTDLIPYLNNAERVDAWSSEQSWSLLAYLSRVNYSFKDKYLLSATYRREGSSRFGKNNKWGDFPAVSVGWRLSEESFIPDLSWLTDLKIRGSWGVTGNNNIGNYSSLASMVPRNYILGNSMASGVVLSSFANADLGWEQSNQIDIGLDLSMFENKLVFIAEYYKKITNDMLLPIDIPVISGFTQTFSNIGQVENKGVELALGYRTKVNDLNIRSNINFSFNRNKVLEIFGENDEMWAGSFYSTYNVSKVGRPIGMLYGFKQIGIFNTDAEIEASPTQDGAIPGVYKYFDANGDGKISYDRVDMIEIGNPHPDFIWALTLGADYKGFDFNILFSGAQNYDIFRNIEATTMNMDGVFNILKSGKNRWRSEQNPGDGVGPTSSSWKWERESNSRYVYDASHAWVKNMSLGYTLPQNSILSNARIYISADNLILITKFPGSNPDIDRRGGVNPGVDDEAYPVPRTFSLGANINF
jgi:TonB-linked SusC/RagA family outer membrane protein